MAFCGLSSVASAGRMLFAFSRDDGLPGSGWLKKVSHRYRTPANSLTAMVVVAWLFTRRGRSSSGPARRSSSSRPISTIFLYAAYGIVHLPRRDDDRTGSSERVWSLGRWSKPIAWMADLLGPRPDGPVQLCPTSGNICLPFMVIIVVFLLVYYFGWARAHFEGPRVDGRRRPS